MAETPTVFAQSAGDPVKVVATTVGANPKISPYDIVVPAGSPIKTVAQLKGQTVGVQEGTVEQFFLVQALAKANVPYSAVQIDNLAVTTASTAVTNGQVAAAVICQPLTALDQATGKIRILASGAGSSRRRLPHREQRRAGQPAEGGRADRTSSGASTRRRPSCCKDPMLAAQTYAKTYGVPLAVAEQAVASVQAGARRSRRPSSATSRTRPTRSRSWAWSRHTST